MSSRRRNNAGEDGPPLIHRGWTPHWGVILAASLLLHAVLETVHADALRIGQYWKKGITFESVEAGTLIYTGSAGDEREIKLAEITALDAAGYPFLHKAHTAMDEGDDSAALQLFSTAGKGVRHPWLRQWIAWQVMQCHIRRGAAKEAVAAYLDLVRQRGDGFYLGQPPLHLLDTVDHATKQDIHARLVSAQARADGAGKTGLEAMLAQLGPLGTSGEREGMDSASPSSAAGAVDDATPEVRPQPEAPSPAKTERATAGQHLGEGPSAVELPAFIRVDDPVTQLLRNGKFEEAVKNVDRLLARDDARHVGLRWYQRGVARRAMAERLDDGGALGAKSRELTLLAGLDFMRVVIYFPTGRYRGPSLVEAGDVHLRLGLDAMALRLLKEALRPPKAISAKENPRYHRRLTQLNDRISAAR